MQMSASQICRDKLCDHSRVNWNLAVKNEAKERNEMKRRRRKWR